MSSVLESKPVAAQDNILAEKLTFSRNLQAVTNKIHATSNIDEIMLELSQDICSLFSADRLTVYVLSDDKQSIISKVKMGLNQFKDLKLPISEQSIAGYCATHKKVINIRDVYDDQELKSYSPQLNFLKEVDKRTGYRTKQMLVAPVIDNVSKDLMGVIQIINSKGGQPFTAMIEEGVTHLAETLAIAFRQRSKGQPLVRGKYDALVANAVISAEELELATRSARRKNLDVELVLLDEFQVKVPAMGDALAQFFDVPYEAYKADRVKPLDLLRNLKRDFCESNAWVPIDDTKDGLIVLTIDPEKIKSSRVVNNVFPKSKIIYKVCTVREFNSTLDQMFGVEADTGGSIDDMLGDLTEAIDTEEGPVVDDAVNAANDNELVKLVNKVIMDAYSQGASDIHIERGIL